MPVPEHSHSAHTLYSFLSRSCGVPFKVTLKNRIITFALLDLDVGRNTDKKGFGK